MILRKFEKYHPLLKRKGKKNMNLPEVQNDNIINKLMSKAELFLPNVILYFERDNFLMRRNSFDIFHSAKSFPNLGGSYSPHFDSFDVAPMRTIRAGQQISEFEFSVRDYQLKMLKGWFIWLVPTGKEKELKEKGENHGFWLFFMNEQFYFYYPHQEKISFSNATGELSLNGKFVVYRSDDQTITKYSLTPNPNYSDFQHFINNCFRVIASKPMDSFIKSFKANKNYPEVNEETASFYRYFFQNPTFLLTVGIDPEKTNTSRDLIKIFIKSINDKIFSIIIVIFFDIFRTKNWKNSYQQKFLIYDVIRTLACTDSEYFEAKKILTNADNEKDKEIDYKKLKKIPIGSFSNRIMTSLYQIGLAVELDNKTELVEALVLFYIHVLFDTDININDENYVTEENEQFCSSFNELSDYSYTLQEPLNIDEIQLVINELITNIDHYIDLFNSSNASTLVENLNSFLNPANQPLKGSKSLSASSSVFQSPKPEPKLSSTDSIPISPGRRSSKPRISKQSSVPSSLKKLPPLPIPPKQEEQSNPISQKPESNTSSDETFSVSNPGSSDGSEQIDPHLFDSFPYNVPPPREKPDESSFLLPPQEGDETSGSSLPTEDGQASSDSPLLSNVAPTNLEAIASPIIETNPENPDTNEKDNNESGKDKEAADNNKAETKNEQNENSPKESKEENSKKEKKEKDDKKKEKEKKKKDSDSDSDSLSSDDDSSYSSLSSSLSDGSDDDLDNNDDDDDSSLSSSSSSKKDSKKTVLKAAPRYDGTEEPPLEERDESDTTIQDDAV